MNFNPLVSIIIPVYNGSNYMREAIDSALNQTYKNIEVLVINDGTNDGGKSERIALEYGAKIRYYFKTNGGVSSAFNLGIQKMKGEYFSWLSHDDVYYPNKVKKQIELLSESGKHNVIIYSDTDYINEYSKLININRITYPSPYGKELIWLLLYRSVIKADTVLIPRNCLKEVRCFDEQLLTSQDYDLWFRLAKKFEFRYIDIPLAKIRIHAEQGSKTINSFFHESCETKIRHFNSLSKDELLSLTEEEKLNNVYFKFAFRYSLNGGKLSSWPDYYLWSILIANSNICKKLFFFLISQINCKVLKYFVKIFPFNYKFKFEQKHE